MQLYQVASLIGFGIAIILLVIAYVFLECR